MRFLLSFREFGAHRRGGYCFGCGGCAWAHRDAALRPDGSGHSGDTPRRRPVADLAAAERDARGAASVRALPPAIGRSAGQALSFRTVVMVAAIRL
jgi:hypothetical protein